MFKYVKASTNVKDLSHILNRFEYEPEVCFYDDLDIGYVSRVITEPQQAIKFNYHSDYWGDADEYQEQNVALITALEPYIGRRVTFNDYFDGEVTLDGIAIDKQYNSVSHTSVVVSE